MLWKIRIIFLFSLLVIVSGCATKSKNVVSASQPETVNISTDSLAWIRNFDSVVRGYRLSMAYPQLGYRECKMTSEIKETFLCLFNSQEEMGYALARASCFIEGSFCGYEKGTVVSLNDNAFRMAVVQIGGYDLKAQDLVRYYNTMTEKCEKDKKSEFCPTPNERELYENFILPQFKKIPNFVLITFARYSSQQWNQVLLHEIMHAQYFQNTAYQQVVETFWTKNMNEKDRSQVRSLLSVAYDKNDEHLMMNEFQAYILQTGSEDPTSLLHKLVPRYKQPLLKILEEANVKPIEIKLSVKK